MEIKYIIGFCLIMMTLSSVSREHNPVLPQPQKIIYGTSQFEVKEAVIGFAVKPCAEDINAARELAAILSKTTSTGIQVRDEGTKGASIIFERTGASDPLPVAGEKPGPGSRESYKIKVTSKNIKITAISSAGLFYGVQTLRQLVEGESDKAFIPEVEIEDWPTLAYRGFMMDMSHYQLPRMEEIKNQIDFLSRWKANQYFFYSEASIELDGYPLLMAEARFTRDQVKEIIRYARTRHIDVIPNMELYGHLHDLFKLEHYSDLSVIPHGGEFIPDDPRVKPLLEDWIAQISKLFQSPFFHIGFDETWFLEYEAKKRGKSPEEFYLGMLKQTTDIVEKQGKIPLVWADMLQKYPSIIPGVSKKAIAVPWHYTALNDSIYDKKLSPFQQNGIPMIVQGALRNWNWVVPAFEVSFLNTDVLITAGKKYNAIGFINSGWTDDALTIMRMAYPDFAYGSIASWQEKPVDRENFFRDYSRTLYSPEVAVLVEKAFTSLSRAESLIRTALGPTDVAIWANPFKTTSLRTIENNMENLRQGRLAAEDAQVAIRRALEYNTDTVTLTALLAGVKMLDYVALKYLYTGEMAGYWQQVSREYNADNYRLLIRRTINGKIHSKIMDLLDAVIQTKEIYREAWLNEYTPFRLGIGLGKYDFEFQFWLRFQRRLEDVNYREGETLPGLDVLTNDL